MRFFRAAIVASVLLVALLSPEAGQAAITGSAEWNWVDYQRDLDSGGTTRFSQFFQQYSLLYHDRQSFRGGRAGGYNVALGYEWSALDLSGSIDEEVDTHKLLYRGELSFTPAKLPFAVRAYSFDLTRSNPSTHNLPETIIDPDIYVGLFNGQHYTTGLTLVVGESQPSTVPQGDFRTALAALPRLMVDYHEDYVRDLKRRDPSHYRTRDLAFVTLNRKKNWFHYRVYEHNDFIDSNNDTEERTLLLGTIDHLYRRQWINLTNWLAISADGSLTQSEGPRKRLYWAGDEFYQLNLFTVARRRDWNFSNFTTMTRDSTDQGDLEKTFDFPLFAEGQFDPQLKWKLAFIGSSREEEYADKAFSLLDREEDNLFTRVQVENSRSLGRIVTSNGEVAWRKTSENGEARAARLGIELRSKRVNDTQDWLASYSLAWFDADGASERTAGPEGGTTYHEHVAEAAINVRPSPSVKAGLSQLLAVGFGNNAVNTTQHIAPEISSSSFGSDDDEISENTTSYRVKTSAYWEMSPPGRRSNRFHFDYDLLHITSSRHRLQVGHHLAYSAEGLRVNARTTFYEGDDLGYTWLTDGLGSLEHFTGEPDLMLTHETRLDYQPNRFWQAGGWARAIWGKGDRGNGMFIDLKQDAAYHLFRTGGLMRRWFSFEQSFEYQQILNEAGVWRTELEFNAVWYATRYLTLDAMIGIRHYGLSSQTEYEFQTSATTTFRKLEARLAYAYGQIDEADENIFLPGATEQRWEVSLKKYF